MKVMLTPEIIVKVWKLHEKNIDSGLIADTLGISEGSARRVIQIMTAAKNGEDVYSIGEPNNHKKLKAFAKSYFAPPELPKVEPPKVEIAEEPCKPTSAEDIFKEFAVSVLFELSHISKLLEKICDDLGVNENGKA